MKVGVTLSTFSSSASGALTVARAADDSGLDGIFVFDHLWPNGQKSRPALSMYPMLGALAGSTRQIRIGSLVARVGLLPDEQVIQSFVSLHEMIGDRLVASLGVGDLGSVPENTAYGIAWPELEDRRASLATILGDLISEGIECWVGATAPETIDIARGAGATVNLWNAGLDQLAAEADRGPATWAGPVPSSEGPASEQLKKLRDTGATWAVWGWPRSVKLVVAALHTAGMEGRRE